MLFVLYCMFVPFFSQRFYCLETQNKKYLLKKEQHGEQEQQNDRLRTY